MGKVKTALLSLDARGTLSNTITFQKRGTGTIVRSTPTPAYRRTLPQVYQRWLYEDYAYRWRQQTPATKQTYQSAGVRFHLTGFQYWMKYHLANLPDIAGYWKMDDNAGATTKDSSRNNTPLIVTGASPATGRIDQAFYFDGVNDFLHVASPPHLAFPDVFTLLFFIRFEVVNIAHNPAAHAVPGVSGWYIHAYANARLSWNVKGVTANMSFSTLPGTISADVYYCLIATYDPTGTCHLYLDNVSLGNRPGQGIMVPTAQDFKLGTYWNNTFWFKGNLDHCIFFTRLLDNNERQRWTDRRYPS